MQYQTPFDSGTRISGTLKLQPVARGMDAAPRSQVSRTGVRSPDKWEVVEARWAAMTRRMQGGCDPRVVDATPQLVLPFGRKGAETPIVLPSDLVAQNTRSTVIVQVVLAVDTVAANVDESCTTVSI